MGFPVPSSNDLIKNIRELASKVREMFLKTLENAASVHSTKDLIALSEVTRAMHGILNADSFYDIVARGNYNVQLKTAAALERLAFELGPIRGMDEITALFRPEISSTLKNFYDHVESLAADLGGSARASLAFREQIERLREAVELYNLQSAEDSRVQEIQWRLEKSQKESGLLRAQLDSSQTELRIREERARSAELRAEQLDVLVSRLESDFHKLNVKVKQYADTEQKLSGLLQAATEQRAEITKIRDEVQTLAADAADNVMAANYGTMASNHARKERFFRWAALLLFAISTLGASLIAWNIGWFDSRGSGDSQTYLWSEVAKKLLVAGGLAGIGLYFSRLASHHRKIEVWSSSLGVQLKTLESYLSGIKDEELKDAIREKFAGLTFGGPPKLVSSAAKGLDAKSIAELAAAINVAIRP